MKMTLVHVELSEANEFIGRLHRHHKPVVGHRFSIGASVDGTLVGVATVGRPVARKTDQRKIVEVTRLCTDGTKNACSFLYSASARAAQHLGYIRIQTFILGDESGASLVATGWTRGHITPGKSWSVPSRERDDKHPIQPKVCWYRDLR